MKDQFAAAGVVAAVVLAVGFGLTHRVSRRPTPAAVPVAVEAPAAWIVIRVRDRGPGIPPAALGRIYEPFFSTKDVGKGTGLGLALVAKIVADHGGVIECESQPRRTVFRVLLPVIANAETTKTGEAVHA